METAPTRSLYRPTLRAGIIVGVIGALAMIFSNLFLQNFGVVSFSGTNAFFVALTQVYLLATVACIPFSAALISAALVMRHLDSNSSRSSEPVENQSA
jgi:energy-converting hydrogenase Eha subunit G